MTTTIERTARATAIRTLRESDLEDLHRVFMEAHRQAGESLAVHQYVALMKSVDAEVSKAPDDAMRYTVAPNLNAVATDENDRLIGFAAIEATGPATGELKNVVVDPASQGCGAGGALMSSIEEQARRSGYRKIVLWTFAHMRAAIRLYEKRNYVRVRDGAPHAHMPAELQPIQMELDLWVDGPGTTDDRL